MTEGTPLPANITETYSGFKYKLRPNQADQYISSFDADLALQNEERPWWDSDAALQDAWNRANYMNALMGSISEPEPVVST